MSGKLKQFSGKVVKQAWGGKSKSAHLAVCLQTKGAPLKLRRPGGNSFVDHELEALVGKSIEIEGKLLDPSTLLMSSWREIE